MIDAGESNAIVLAICDNCGARYLAHDRDAAHAALARHEARAHPGQKRARDAHAHRQRRALRVVDENWDSAIELAHRPADADNDPEEDQ